MSRFSNRIRDRATASGARADAPPVLSTQWTAGEVKSERGPQNCYRIRGSRCAPSLEGGDKYVKTNEVPSNRKHSSLILDPDLSKGSSDISVMEVCSYCGKSYKKVRGMALHLKSCHEKKLHDKALEHRADKSEEDKLPVFCFICGLIFECQSELSSHSKVCSKTSLSKVYCKTPNTRSSSNTSQSKFSSYNIVAKDTSYGAGMLKFRDYKKGRVNQYVETTGTSAVSTREDLCPEVPDSRESSWNTQKVFSLIKESLSSSNSAPFLDLPPDLSPSTRIDTKSDTTIGESPPALGEEEILTECGVSPAATQSSTADRQSPFSDTKAFCPYCKHLFSNPSVLKPHLLECRQRQQGILKLDKESQIIDAETLIPSTRDSDSEIDFTVETPIQSDGAPGTNVDRVLESPISSNGAPDSNMTLSNKDIFGRACTVVLDDVLEIKARKKGGQVVQGYQCFPCKKVFTCYRGLEVHRRANPECTNYTYRCELCTRLFKNEKGLRQHQERYDCGPASIICNQASSQGVSSDCQQSVDCNDQLLAGSDSHHIAHSQQDFEAERRKLETLADKEGIKWPRMADEKAWKTLDSKAKKQLLTEGSIEGRIAVLEEVIYDEAKNLFGCKERFSGGQERVLSRREKKLREVRKQIRHLTKMARNCEDDEEKGGLLLARQDLLDDRRKLRQAENRRKQRWRRKNIRKNFYNDPYRTCKEVLSEKKSVPLKVDANTIKSYVREVASDPLKDVDLGPLPGLLDAPLPDIPFDVSKFKFSDFKYILRKTRNASRPGHNQIPYKVYKKCPELAKYLFGLFISVLKSGSTPLHWRLSDGIFLPKTKDPKENNINDYRQIALLNVEGKLYWSLVSRRLYSYLVVDNHYIRTNQQKGAIKGVAGCWEHTSMVWSALKDAKKSKSPLALLWLDLANAYGTVPHKLIEFALKRYHVPENWIKIVLDYYDGLWGRSSSSGSYSDWTRYEKGIFAGCTLSVILFLVAFNVFLDFVDRDDIEKYKINGNPIEVFRGFMDDLSTLTTRVPMTVIALERTNTALKWGRMSLKPSKSRSLVMYRGKVQDIEPFQVDGVKIPGLHKEPLRTLGRVFDCSITDKDSIKTVHQKFVSSLIRIDKSKLTGFMKLWALNHILQFQIRWDFMIYEIPLTTIEAMERKQNIFIRKWLGVARNFTDVALYSTHTPCPLPLKSLVSLFQTTKVTSFLQLSHSQDNQVTHNLQEHKTGRKWSTVSALNRAQARMNHQKIVGDVRGACGSETEAANIRAGLGFIASPSIPNLDGKKDHRKHISKIMEEEHSEQLTVKAVSQSVQGAWTRWKQYLQRDLSWKSLLSAKSNLVRFCLGSTFDTLSTPNNLRRMGLISDPQCSLCNQDGCGILHILSACNVAFAQKRYDYRHNNVLRCLADGIQSFLNVNKVVSKGIKTIHFVKESGTVKEKKRRKPDLGLLHQAPDFVMDVDLNKQMKYPSHIAETLRRPDIVLYSNQRKMVIHVELTVPGEEKFEISNNKKYSQYCDYSELGKSCIENGWTVYCFPVEVGVRGYVAQSLPQCLRKLGLGKLRTRKISKSAGDTALRSSFWLWVLRDRKEWSLGTGFSSGSDTRLTQATEKVLQPENNKPPPTKPFKTKGKRHYPCVEKTIKSYAASEFGKAKEDIASPVVTAIKSKPGDKITRPPCGIPNLGNSCFLNATLQCLFNVLSQNYNEEGHTDAFHQAFSEWKLSSSNSVDVSSIMSSLATLNPQFGKQDQQDAHECLMYLFHDKFEPSAALRKLQTLFKGSFQSSTVCDLCHKAHKQPEDFSCIELDMPPSSTPTSIGQLMERFQEKEVIPFTRYRVCPLCDKIGSAVRQLTVADTGEWLILYIKRFRTIANHIGKNKRWVSYPLEGFSVLGKLYDLHASVCHYGSRKEGHYIAFIRSDDIWYKCNDSVVSTVSREVAADCNNDIYLLFYKKQVN